MDNSFMGTYTTVEGGWLTDVPRDSMPIGSYVAEEMTPPEGCTKSPDQSKVKQSFHWNGKDDVALVFENDRPKQTVQFYGKCGSKGLHTVVKLQEQFLQNFRFFHVVVIDAPDDKLLNCLMQFSYT